MDLNCFVLGPARRDFAFSGTPGRMVSHKIVSDWLTLLYQAIVIQPFAVSTVSGS